MSGISVSIPKGNYKLDHREINIISNSLKFKGPDSSNYLKQDNKVFFQNMFFATSEDMHENLPSKTSDGITICSDSRIDNRSELIKKLYIKKDHICDSEIIIKSYKKWGENCVNHIIGAFVFIIYDKNINTTFIARDQLGFKSIYYIEDKNQILFSSSVGTFLELNNYDLSINTNRVKNYLSFTSNKDNETFYKEIKKIPKASICIIKNKKITTKKYYQLKKIKVNKNISDSDYIKKFKDIFFEVIKSHSRSPNKIVSSALSGGLDSTSISKTLSYLNKNNTYDHHTFSCIFKGLKDEDFKKTDELNFIKDAANSDNNHFIYIDNNKNGPVSKLNYFQKFHSSPVAAINGYIHSEMFKSAYSLNSRVFLDGFDGDTVISHGYEKLFDYAREFKFNRLFKERKKLDNRFNIKFSYLRTIKTYILKPLIPSFLDYLYRFIFRKNILPVSDIKMLKFKKPKAVNSYKYIKDFYGYYPHKYSGDAQEYHIRNINNSIWEFSFEIIENLSLIDKVEVRYPFFDLRIVEFCSSLPKHLKNKNGLNRYILRESLKEILPQSIYERVTKANLSPVSKNNVSKINIKQLQQKINNSEILRECLDEGFFIYNLEEQVKNNEIETYKIYQLMAILSWENKIKKLKDSCINTSFKDNM